MKVRLAEKKDLDRIMEIYDIAKHFMAEHDNPTQWPFDRPYPTRELLEKDIDMNKLYVVYEDNNIYGVFALVAGNDPSYEYLIEGSWPNNEPYSTIHRIASSQEKKGVAKTAFDFAKTKSNNLRIDTHQDNYVMQNASQKNDFKYCAMVNDPSVGKRLVYQWIKD